MTKCAELANLIGNINAGGGGANKNVIINGAMNVCQRNVSATGLGADSDDGKYPTVDRFQISVGNTSGRLTMTQDSSAPSGFANSTKLACTTADTSIASNELLVFKQKIEGQNLQAFAKGTSDAKPFAVSFYVKGNASATYVCELMDYDNSNRHVNKSFTVTTDWTRVELSFPPDTTGALDDDNAHSFDLNIWLHSGSDRTSGSLQTTWGALNQANRAVGISSFFDSTDRTFFITGVQLEVGQNPTAFEHINNFGEELHKCQRYFQKTNAQFHLAGRGTGSTTGIASMPLTVPLRASPTTLDDNGLVFRAYTGSAVDIGDGTVPTVASFAETDNILLLNMSGFDNISDDRIANFQLFGTQNATTGFTMDSEL
jgi:hypothetical protein